MDDICSKSIYHREKPWSEKFTDSLWEPCKPNPSQNKTGFENECWYFPGIPKLFITNEMII